MGGRFEPESAIGGKMTSLLRFDEITSLLTGSISEALQVSNVGFLIYDSKKEMFPIVLTPEQSTR